MDNKEFLEALENHKATLMRERDAAVIGLIDILIKSVAPPVEKPTKKGKSDGSVGEGEKPVS